MNTLLKCQLPSSYGLGKQCFKDIFTKNDALTHLIAELQIQILPLIENLEWLYIWGVVCCLLLYAIVRRSVGRSVGRSEDLRIGGCGIFGDLGGSWG